MQARTLSRSPTHHTLSCLPSLLPAPKVHPLHTLLPPKKTGPEEPQASMGKVGNAAWQRGMEAVLHPVSGACHPARTKGDVNRV